MSSILSQGPGLRLQCKLVQKKQKPNSSYIFPPTKLMCGEETPPHSGHQSHLQSGVTAKKIGSTSSGILLSVFMSLGGVLSIQTRTVAFQDHLADLGQLWS